MSKVFGDHSRKCGPLITIEDISHEDMSLIAHEIFRLMKKYDDPYDAYIFVLSKYGIMCPHPQIKRLYNGFKKSAVPQVQYKWYNCSMCKCSAINEKLFPTGKSTLKDKKSIL